MTCGFPSGPAVLVRAWDGSWDEPFYGTSVPPRRRRRGYIEQLPSGSYRAVVYAGIDPLTQRLRYLRVTRKTYAEAEIDLTRLQREVDQDKHPKSAITVAEAVEQWMSVAELEETTREGLLHYRVPRLGARLAWGRLVGCVEFVPPVRRSSGRRSRGSGSRRR